MSSYSSEGNWRQLRTPDASTRATPFRRPSWPWSAYSHRHAASSSSIPTLPASSTFANLSTSAETGAAMSASTTERAFPTGHAPAAVNSTTRQWNFTAFEWTVNDVRALRDVVESPIDESGQNEDDKFEVLREHPSVGDGKFILEIARPPTEPKAPSTPLEGPSSVVDQSVDIRIPTLSLFITSLMDHTNMDFELSASLLVAIKCVDERGSDRGSPAQWAWEFWEQSWCFRKESEYWECTLPSLSTLLQHPGIASKDSFIICVQIHCPVGPFVPQLPSAHYIPRDLLDGFEASLDNAYTGDVVFVTLERSPAPTSVPPSPHSMSSHSRISAHKPQTARKRVIYAHSDILKRRSNYFNTMLTSCFAESSSGLVRDRKLHTIVVEDADFLSVYWLLKWVYTNWVIFKDEDDPRIVFDTATGGLSVKHLTGGAGEWEWRTMIRTDPSSESAGSLDGTESEAKASRSVASIESSHIPLPPPRHAEDTVAEGKTPVCATPLANAAPSVFARLHAGNSHRPLQTPLPLSRQTPSKPSSIPLPVSSGSASSGAPTSYTKRGPPSRSSKSPMAIRGVSHQLSTDPHSHPTSQPPPASALSIYKIAHRYLLPGLAQLALDHMMSTLTPRSAFPLLLASHFWDDLHVLVEDYIVEHWHLVSEQDDFESCCEEVAAGEWGPHGGKTLAALFRRLRSPASLQHVR